MRIVVAALMLLLMLPSAAFAWGFEAHKFITERMIALLPAELQPLFERRKAYVIERSIDPDLWRVVGWDAEAPNHFVDLDFFGAYPFSDLPHEYDRAVQKYGKNVIDEQGRLPWRAQEFYGRLQREFESLKRSSPPAYALDNIVLYSAILSHYIGDGHVPLHSVVNYDGQKTGQQGIHNRWESELFERNRATLTLRPPPMAAVKDPREFMFDTLLASNRLVDGVLAADKKAAAGRQFYDDAYFAVLATEQLGVLQQRLSESISAVAALITGAWDHAGRPSLPPDRPRAPRPINRTPPG
jgi:hypothetical protein